MRRAEKTDNRHKKHLQLTNEMYLLRNGKLTKLTEMTDDQKKSGEDDLPKLTSREVVTVGYCSMYCVRFATRNV